MHKQKQKNKLIRVKPEQWSHHHTDRILHVSGFTLALALIMSTSWIFGTALGVASADNSQQLSTGVGLHIPAADEGPVVVIGGGGGPTPGSPSSPPTNQPQGNLEYPEVTVMNGQSIFNTQFPSFYGHTNIKNAIVSLEVHSDYVEKATVRANASGDWSWTTRQPISPGHHTLLITAIDPNEARISANTNFDFTIELPAGQSVQQPTGTNPPTIEGKNLFGVAVNISDKFKAVHPGDEIVIQVNLSNLGDATHAKNVIVEYQIQDSNGEDVIQTVDTLSVAGSISYLKSFQTSTELQDGRYTVTASISDSKNMVSGSDYFDLAAPAPAPVVAPTDYRLLFSLLTAFLLLFILIAYWEYNKIKLLTVAIAQLGGRRLAKTR